MDNFFSQWQYPYQFGAVPPNNNWGGLYPHPFPFGSIHQFSDLHNQGESAQPMLQPPSQGVQHQLETLQPMQQLQPTQPQSQQLQPLQNTLATALQSAMDLPSVSSSNGDSVPNLVSSPFVAPRSNSPSIDENGRNDEGAMPTLSPQLQIVPSFDPSPTSLPSPDSAHSILSSNEKEGKKKRGKRRRTNEEDQGSTKKIRSSSDKECIFIDDPSLPPSSSLSYVLQPRPAWPHLFATIPGRLGVVGYPRSYNVSVAEMSRRISAPEFLNRSHITPFLKRGKIKNCSKDLEEELQAKGIKLAEHGKRRKEVAVSTLTALTEEESLQLSLDHRDLLHQYFPHMPFARLLISNCPAPSDLISLMQQAVNTQKEMAEQTSLAKEWTEGGVDSTTSSSSPLHSFSLVTHCLGPEEWFTFCSLLNIFAHTLELEANLCLARAKHADDGGYLASNQFPPGFNKEAMPADETPFREEQNQLKEGTRIFGEVPGRLTLQNRKYTIGMAEVYHRLRQPESLNLSILGSMLRKGKTEDNGKVLKGKLAHHGIDIHQGRRKAAKVTCFTALCEEESLIFARDMGEAIHRYFPFQVVAKTLNTRSDCALPFQRQIQLASTSHLACLLSALITSLRVPISDRIPSIISPFAYIIYPYTHITHGFGPDEAVNWFDLIAKVTNEAKDCLPQQWDPSSV